MLTLRAEMTLKIMGDQKSGKQRLQTVTTQIRKCNISTSVFRNKRNGNADKIKVRSESVEGQEIIRTARSSSKNLPPKPGGQDFGARFGHSISLAALAFFHSGDAVKNFANFAREPRRRKWLFQK